MDSDGTNRRQLTDYPALRPVYQAELSHAYSEQTEVTTSINVHTADANLLFRAGYYHEHRNDENQAEEYTQYDYCRPVTHDGELGNVLDWHDPHLQNRVRFVRDLFLDVHGAWADLGLTSIVGPQTSRLAAVDAIIWVSRRTYERAVTAHIAEDSTFRLQQQRIEVEITLYKAPPDGWRPLLQTADPLSTVRLQGLQLLYGPSGLIMNAPHVLVAWDELWRLCDVFDEHVWSAGMSSVQAINALDLRAEMGSVTLDVRLTDYSIQVGLSRDQDRLVLEAPRGGTPPRPAAIDASMASIRQMLDEVRRWWQAADSSLRRGAFSIIR